MTAVALLVIVAFVAIFRLGNQASAGVNLNDPVVWVEDGARGRVLQVNGSTGEIYPKDFSGRLISLLDDA